MLRRNMNYNNYYHVSFHLRNFSTQLKTFILLNFKYCCTHESYYLLIFKRNIYKKNKHTIQRLFKHFLCSKNKFRTNT